MTITIDKYSTLLPINMILLPDFIPYDDSLAEKSFNDFPSKQLMIHTVNTNNFQKKGKNPRYPGNQSIVDKFCTESQRMHSRELNCPIYSLYRNCLTQILSGNAPRYYTPHFIIFLCLMLHSITGQGKSAVT